MRNVCEWLCKISLLHTSVRGVPAVKSLRSCCAQSLCTTSIVLCSALASHYQYTCKIFTYGPGYWEINTSLIIVLGWEFGTGSHRCLQLSVSFSRIEGNCFNKALQHKLCFKKCLGLNSPWSSTPVFLQKWCCSTARCPKMQINSQDILKYLIIGFYLKASFSGSKKWLALPSDLRQNSPLLLRNTCRS